MQTIKCPKCGSVRMTLKYAGEEKRPGVFDTILFWFLGIVTFGLYFLFYAFAERKRTELGTEYYECMDCHLKTNASKFHFAQNFVEQGREELSEEDKKAIREIGKHPINMDTWKDDRKKAVHEKLEKRENMQDDE